MDFQDDGMVFNAHGDEPQPAYLPMESQLRSIAGYEGGRLLAQQDMQMASTRSKAQSSTNTDPDDSHSPATCHNVSEPVNSLVDSVREPEVRVDVLGRRSISLTTPRMTVSTTHMRYSLEWTICEHQQR